MFSSPFYFDNLLFVILMKINEFEFLVFNATFSNISIVLWQPVLVMEEAGVAGAVECTFFVIYKDGREPTPYW